MSFNQELSKSIKELSIPQIFSFLRAERSIILRKVNEFSERLSIEQLPLKGAFLSNYLNSKKQYLL